MYGNILAICQRIVIEAGEKDTDVRVDKTFTDYATLVFDIVNTWPKEKLEHPRLGVFLRRLKELRDDFEQEVLLDPMVLYKPKCDGIRAFLSSVAKVRYLHSGNRYGKTAAAMADNYYLLTGKHPYRPIPKYPSSVIMMGPDYTNYASMVFEPKYIDGEPDSYLTPLFPYNGRWLHSFNRNTKTIRLGCRECAAKLMARDCPHTKPALYLCSDQGKPESIAGGAHGKLAIDEIVKKEFFTEGMQRLKSVIGSYADVTLTPIYGQAWWTYEDLKVPHDDPTYENRYFHPMLKKHVKYIEVFTGSQYEGNLVMHSDVDAEVASLERQEGGHEIIRLRVYGEHVSLAASKVFDQDTVRAARENVRPATHGELFALNEGPENTREALRDLTRGKLRFEERPNSPFYVWQPPDPAGQYVIGADVAEGLTRGDRSVAHVYRMRPLDGRLHLELVAKYRAAVNPIPYSYALLKLSVWYFNALLVPERNGPGHSVLHELTEELYYYEVFQGARNLSDVAESLETMYGVATTGESKPTLVSLGQNSWRSGDHSYVTTYDREFLYEMEHYVQERSKTGRTIVYQGEGNCHDDEVMAYLLANYATITQPDVYDYSETRGVTPEDPYESMSPKRQQFWRGVHARLRQQEREKEDPW